MARITDTRGESVFQIRKWKGLNETSTGDTKLQLGEATLCDNWKVTRDGNLIVRPGTKTVLDLSGGTGRPVKALWYGYIQGVRYLIAACNGHLWSIAHPDGASWNKTDIGSINTIGTVHMFGYSEKLYIMTGKEYKVYDGATLSDVAGYRPVVAIGVPPAGGGTLLEQVNKLNGTRRVFLSPDGKSNTFQLPESNLLSIDWAKDRATGATRNDYTTNLAAGTITFNDATAFETIQGDDSTTTFALSNFNIKSLQVNFNGFTMSPSEYAYNATLHEITFAEAPSILDEITIVETLAVTEGTNTIEVAYTVTGDYSGQIKHMRYSELFSGATDNRVFLYGDGSNLVYYSGVEYDGSPSAEYFPDMNVLNIGDANTPVTSLIKHYSRLMAFKDGSAYSISYSTITLADGSTTPAFYVTPINKTIGNAAPGQVQLVLNDPITLNGRDIYRWKNNTSYASNLTLDERQARRISDMVSETAAQFDAKSCIMYDHNYGQEFYIVYRDRALVYNYAADAWYTYSNFPARCFAAIDRELYMGDNNGHLRQISETWRSDDGAAIHAVWQSGSLPFGAEWLKKYSMRVFIGMKPVRDSLVRLYTNSDRKIDDGDGKDSVKRLDAIDFGDMDFTDFTFSTSQIPRIIRHKLKQKKYAYMQIILESNSATKTARLTSMDITVRNTVYMRTIR